jgi:uncharacterized surface protein with fasciclin (FAS1) repeats
MQKNAFPRRTLLLGAALGLSMPLLQACGGGDDHAEIPHIVDFAKGNPDLSILVEAVVAAGLADTLSTDTVTVFAPTNAAFAALLAELGISKEALLGKAIEPLDGGFFKVEAGSSLRITDGRNRVSQITTTDVLARNGVVHVVDRVLLPANQDIVDTAQSLPEFSVLVEAVVAADLVSALQNAAALTVFAPTNAAFATLLAELGLSKEALFANKPLLTQVLTYHVLGARVLKAEVPVGTAIATLQGQTFTIGADLQITDRRGRTSQIIGTDVFTSNGVIHVIDRVLLPAA